MPKVTFLGHSAFLVEHGGHSVIIDPFLTGNPVAAMKAEDVEVEAVIVSHAHGDHLGDSVSICKRCDATFIATFELAETLQAQGVKAHSLSIGGGHDFPFGRVKLTQAFHGSGIERDGGFLYGGMPAGILLEMGGRTIYHAGDTGLFGDMELIGRLHKPHLALLPIGDNYTMGPDDAVEAVRMLKPHRVVPMHYNTFPVIQQDPTVFQKRVERLSECVILTPGQSLEV